MKSICTPLTLWLLAAAAAWLPAAAGAQQAAAVTGNAEAARPYISNCTGCHGIPGYQASFPRVYRVPKIGGQSAKYIEGALLAYRNGSRDHPTMRAIAAPLTDQQIADLAAYYSAAAGQKGSK